MNYLICKKYFYYYHGMVFMPGNKYVISDYHDPRHHGLDICINTENHNLCITFSKFNTETYEYRWNFFGNEYYIYDYFYTPDELRLLKLESL